MERTNITKTIFQASSVKITRLKENELTLKHLDNRLNNYIKAVLKQIDFLIPKDK